MMEILAGARDERREHDLRRLLSARTRNLPRGNHWRFFWRERGVRYVATLHHFGRRARRLAGSFGIYGRSARCHGSRTTRAGPPRSRCPFPDRCPWPLRATTYRPFPPPPRRPSAPSSCNCGRPTWPATRRTLRSRPNRSRPTGRPIPARRRPRARGHRRRRGAARARVGVVRRGTGLLGGVRGRRGDRGRARDRRGPRAQGGHVRRCRQGDQPPARPPPGRGRAVPRAPRIEE